MVRRIKIFDTTLRDGEQSPGATLNHNEKIMIAKQLERLNVDIIEAGFAFASEDDFNAVNEIAESIKKPIICSLARCKKEDIDSAAKALEPAKKSRIHVFLATSPIHMEYKLKMTPEKVIEEAGKWVKYATQFTSDVEFSPEDAGRSEPKFLHKVLEKVIDAGATTLNIPDTVGYTQPKEFGEIIKGIIENVPNYNESITISSHCHNDLGLAVANSLSAIEAGASQIECTINGIGERAGNAALEEVVMNIYSRKNIFNAKTGINLKEIYNTSKMVSNLTSLQVQANKSIVGKNAFAHEAGIHQHGVLAKREVYEIINPKTIGKESELVIGKHSGKAAINDFLEKKGYSLTEKQLKEITEKIKELADSKKQIFDDDVLAIASNVTAKLSKENNYVIIKEVEINSGNTSAPSAKVKLIVEGKEKIASAEGVGPVDAMANAIAKVLENEFELKEYHLNAINGGTDALAEVSISISDKSKKIFFGDAVNQDITMASAEALVKCINRFIEYKKRGSIK